MKLFRTIIAGLVILTSVQVEAEFISEETPPASCGYKLVVGVNCRGNWCDDIEPICGSEPHEMYDVRWTAFVSEEGAAEARCHVPNPWERGDWPQGEPAFITGFACNGANCDNVALECVALRDAFPGSLGAEPPCQWTGWVSEEGGGSLRFPDGMAAIAMKCRGGRCDEKSFFVCPIQRRQ